MARSGPPALGRGRLVNIHDEVILEALRIIAATKIRGHTLSFPDVLIAAQAMVNGLIVATRNTADFQRAGVPVLNPWLA